MLGRLEKSLQPVRVAVGFRKQRQQKAKERVQLPDGEVGKKIKASVRTGKPLSALWPHQFSSSAEDDRDSSGCSAVSFPLDKKQR